MMFTLASSEMLAKVNTLWPEIVLLVTAFIVMIAGLSPRLAVRRATAGLTGFALVIAAALVAFGDAFALPSAGPMVQFIKLAVCLIGLLLLFVAIELPDEFEAEGGRRPRFDPANVSRGEFYGFFLLSLIGVMLTAGADDLIWLFLALELTSLPTYVMVALSRDRLEAPEAAVKYFFLGSLSAAVFLYGFALIYGATGTTEFGAIRDALAAGVSPLALAGFVLALVGVSFKIAAVPMHFYTADVYQGAATPVTAFLAFVPKTAGFAAMILLLGLVGWPLDQTAPVLLWAVWVLAVVTQLFGNTLALLQHNVKRVLAYSSIAHSGYMMVGLVAGPGLAAEQPILLRNGVGAILFYLVAYGVMNLGAFAVLGVLKRRGEEAETFDDLKGLVRRAPGLAAVMGVCVFGLAGMPPLVGFWGKLYLIGAAVSAGHIVLAVLLVIASAIAAVYYLRIVAACFLVEPVEGVERARLPWRALGAVLAAIAVVALSIVVGPLSRSAREAGNQVIIERPANDREWTEGDDGDDTTTTAALPETTRHSPRDGTEATGGG